ncbi:MAG: acetyl-CoA synthetase [Solirubrobacteraceae bacterium]|nr:acetyl-CoA synthetase [Solirubrobacteraceae bacterium]
MNYVRDVVESAPPDRLAMIELSRDGARRRWTFGEVADRSRRLSGTLAAHGVGRGDVVMTLMGNRAEWVFAILACVRLGAIALPCTEQLRAKDLRLRLDRTAPAAILADVRNLDVLGEASPSCPVLAVPDEALFAADPTPPAEPAAGTDDGAFIIFTSGTSGEPKAVLHGTRYLSGQALQAEHWLDARPGDLVWCTAAAGWSKSARNTFIAPWLRGASVLLHDARFDPGERLEILERERVSVLCMSPTEYRIMAARTELPRLPQLRSAVAAGEALGPDTIAQWREETGVVVRDGFGQTETGALTGMGPADALRPGSMGRPLPGVRTEIVDGELVLDPRSVPTFFTRYLGAEPHSGPWRTGDRVDVDEDGYLWHRGRVDDLIISSGYRISPGEVEAALLTHSAVADVGVIAAPDAERGAIVRAVVVLRDGVVPSASLVADLQAHVKQQTAPYKFPRVIDFADHLPRTPSGKLRRAALRGDT